MAIKVSHPHVWLYVLRRRPREAIAGAAIVVAIVGLTVPITGVGLWQQWLDQLRLATDPAWPLGGIAVSRLVNVVVGAAVVVLLVAAVVSIVPARHAGAWIGVLTVVGAPSLHNFGMLFLLPALLLIRAEIALVAAILMATTTYEGTWAGIVVTVVGMVAAHWNPQLLEAPERLGVTRTTTESVPGIALPALPDRDEHQPDRDPDQWQDRDRDRRDGEGGRDPAPGRARPPAGAIAAEEGGDPERDQRRRIVEPGHRQRRQRGRGRPREALDRVAATRRAARIVTTRTTAVTPI